MVNVEFIIICDGYNHHQTETFANLNDAKLIHQNSEYKIHGAKNLFKKRHRLFSNKFYAVFKKDESDPIGLGESLTVKKGEVEIPISSNLLYVVSKATIWKTAWADFFRKQIPGKKLAFAVIILVVATLVGLQLTGRLNIMRFFRP